MLGYLHTHTHPAHPTHTCSPTHTPAHPYTHLLIGGLNYAVPTARQVITACKKDNCQLDKNSLKDTICVDYITTGHMTMRKIQ